MLGLTDLLKVITSNAKHVSILVVCVLVISIAGTITILKTEAQQNQLPVLPLPPYDGSGAVVTVGFDHGFKTQYNPMLYMAKDNFAGTIWIVTNRSANPAGFMPMWQAKQMYNLGWTINSHSRNHLVENSLLPPSTLLTEINGSKQDLELQDYAICGFFPPSNNTSAQAKLIIAKEYNYSFFDDHSQNTLTSIAHTKTVYGIPFVNAMSVTDPNTNNLGYLHNFTAVKQQIDYAVQHKTWLMIHFHDIINGTAVKGNQLPSQFSLFTQIIDYLKQNSDSGLLRVEPEAQALGLAHC